MKNIIFNSMAMDEWDYNVLMECARDLPYGDYIVIGSLGLWHGRVSGYKEFRDLTDAFRSEYESVWYIDRGNLKAVEYHHDGINSLLFRAWKDDLSDDQKDHFLEKILRGTYTAWDVSRYTRSVSSELQEAGIY